MGWPAQAEVHGAHTPAAPTSEVGVEHLKKLSKGVTVQATDTCFIMMPFADPIGGYYETVYQPAMSDPS